MGIAEAEDRSFFLGLPNTMGCNKQVILGYIKERIQKRVLRWEGWLLSKAGKEILLKTVVQALPNYAMSVFLLPLDMCKDMERMMSKYWWKLSSTQSSGISWMGWHRMCKHKSRSGMGFRNLRDFNIALLGKQGWRLLDGEESLVSRIFKAHYYPKGFFLDAELGSNPSFIWQSVWEDQISVKAEARRSIGTMAEVNIMQDHWLPDEENPYMIL
ncbi:uncharacterized mitochondrial protein AtMg00310-like [Humulus lupulus]|uniref:uncharacterized mitochondrial protein AtMg00310-like n=1 Tax=Humulus lupulus TaxID=3486 RepID=UPI002B410ADD|nr:uncharacterized mitochondrial protein AtMg00310-like [Humulus lupulus]